MLVIPRILLALRSTIMKNSDYFWPMAFLHEPNSVMREFFSHALPRLCHLLAYANRHKYAMADPASAAMTAHQQMGTCAPVSARPDVRSWTHSHGCYRMHLESWAALLSNSARYIKWNTATASEYFSSSTEVTVGPSTFPVSLDCSSSDHLRTSIERAGYTYCETYRVFCSAIVIMSLFIVIPQGDFLSQAAENNCPYRRVVGF